jgi:hypothetical protein
MGKNRNKFKQDEAGSKTRPAGVTKTAASKENSKQQQQSRGGGPSAVRSGGGGNVVDGKSSASAVREPSAPSSSSEFQKEGPPFKLAVQPVKAKYGGMGFAKPSTFVNLHDSEFNEKFEALFYEHIKGWAGFSYTKARKKQEQGQMLWKQRLLAKQGRPVPQAQASADPAGKALTKQQRRKLKAQQDILNFKG